MQQARDIVDHGRSRSQRRFHHRRFARVDADRGAHFRAGFYRRGNAGDLVALPYRFRTGPRAFAADVEQGRARFQHGRGVFARIIGIVQKAAAVGKAVGCYVENTGNLGLVEPDGAARHFQRRVCHAQVRPLRLGLCTHAIRQFPQNLCDGVGCGEETLHHFSLASQDHGEAAGVDHPPRQPDGVAMLALRTGGDTDGADIDAVAHARCFRLSCSRRQPDYGVSRER